MQPELSDRAKQVLKLLVNDYIEQGQPVGSRALSQLPELPYSSATIRSVMSDLEGAGLLMSPHTSAGRIPTAQGYRFYVDSLMTVQPLNQVLSNNWQQQFGGDLSNPHVLMKSVSGLLSNMTQMAGLVTSPKRNQSVFRHIEFLPLSSQRVLVILVLNKGEVQNRLITLKREFIPSELEQAGNYLTYHFSGRSLREVRHLILKKMKEDKMALDQAMAAVLEMAVDVTDEQSSFDFALDGHANLLGLADSDVNELQRLFGAFSEKRSVLDLLDQCLGADGVQIYIGEESGFDVSNCSIITAPYQQDDESIGMIGVIGPTRMDYNRVVGIVDMTSRLMTMASHLKNSS